MLSAKIAVIGDLHSSWHAADTDYFNDSSYELLLFTGDLGSSGLQDGVELARSLSRLSRPTLVMLGNNDAAQYGRITAELSYQQGRDRLLSGRVSWAPGGVGVHACGLDLHRFQLGALDVSVIAGRPFAMGNSELSSPEALAATYGVTTLEESRARLRELVDRAESEYLLFLAHNGPAGLGTEASAPWGRDFHPEAGDWGDEDLADAVAYAEQQGRRVLAVVAGHMHWRLRGGGERRWQERRGGVLYLNPARVPRIERSELSRRHYHVSLTLRADGAEAREVVHEHGFE